MTTLQNLIDRCEAQLSDSGNTTWSAANIEQWCRDAIADYSQHFPRILNTDISTGLNGRQYDLPAGFLDAVTVEYPQGGDPPEYLKRRHHLHPDFWSKDGYFDILERDDASDVDELLISQKPAAGETIRVHYTAFHDHTIATSGTLTIQTEHEHLLVHYVLWRAALELKAAEEAAPTSSSSLLMSQYAINVDRARRAYVDALAKAAFSQSQSKTMSWAGQEETLRRIY